MSHTTCVNVGYFTPRRTHRYIDTVDRETPAGEPIASDATDFVGRRREVADLRNLLDAHRLVTLIGTGGVGKTRLATRVAGEGRGGVSSPGIMVDLTPVTDPTLVPSAFAAALGIHSTSLEIRGDRIATVVGDQQIVLLVDNCEHVLDAAARVIDTLMRSCRNARILATSREPLGVSGEVTYPVSPFAVPAVGSGQSRAALRAFDGVELFLKRARQAVPTFEITDENAAVIGEVCARLEGIPLAIELAAVRLRALPPAELLVRLEDRFRLLSSGCRTSDVRHQTMRASLDWSYELCSEEERELWARLAVFAGSFTLDAAEQVCAGGVLPAGDVYTAVASLVDKSILVRVDDRRARYRMLESIREYGLEKLSAAGRERDLREAHLLWFERQAEIARTHWVSSEQPTLADALRLDHDNLRRALTTCIERPDLAVTGLRIATLLEPYWLLRHIGEGRHWFVQLLEASDVSGEVRVKSLRVLSLLEEWQGEYDAATDRLRLAAAAVGESSGEDVEAHLTQMRGLNALLVARAEEAVDHLEACLPYFERQSDRWLAIETQAALCTARYMVGDLQASVGASEAIIEETTAMGEVWFRSYAMWACGMALSRLGEFDRATAMEREAALLKASVGDTIGFAACVEALAWAMSSGGKHAESGVLLGAALRAAEEAGSQLTAIADMPGHRAACQSTLRKALGAAEFERSVQRGRSMTTDQLVAMISGKAASNGGRDAHGGLTRREREIAELVARGLTNRQIAGELVIAVRTAEGHIERIMNKLGFTSRAQVAAWHASRSGTGAPADGTVTPSAAAR